MANSTTPVTFEPSLPEETDDQALWAAIRNRTSAIGFERYQDFITQVFCGGEITTNCVPVDALIGKRDVLGKIGHGTNAFDTLRTATEAFLLLNCGVYVSEGEFSPKLTTSQTSEIGGRQISVETVVDGVKPRLYAAAIKWRNGSVASLRNILLRRLDTKTGCRHQTQVRTG